ncbi:MAG: CCA tRNA nucleotidyltransferase, partial [bacterium]
MPGSDSGSLARRIVARLRAAGHQAYLVGGCVRDILLGGEPGDYDVATDARPERVLELFPRAQFVGAHFGGARVRGDGAEVEVATFRSDPAYQDGGPPVAVEVEYVPP